jgi:hypothetical protein
VGKMVTEDTGVEVDHFEATGRMGPYRDKACDDIGGRAVKLDGDRPEERQMETIDGLGRSPELGRSSRKSLSG